MSQDVVPRLIIMISGAILIVIGVVFVGLQMHFQGLYEESHGLEVGPAIFMYKSKYVGMGMVAIGAVLEVVGYLTPAKWSRRSHRNSK